MEYPRTCPECSRIFKSKHSFFEHFVQACGEDTRCMSYDELTTHGFVIEEGVWVGWMELHSEFWQPDRETWSCLYKPGEMYDDLAPKDRIKKPKTKWQRFMRL